MTASEHGDGPRNPRDPANPADPEPADGTAARDPGDLTAAHALDALDGDERLALERALEASPEVRREADAFAEVAAQLAGVTEPVAPPPALRDRLDALLDQHPQVSADAPAEAPSGATDAPPAPVRDPSVGPAAHAAARRWFQRPATLITAVAAAAAVLIGVILGVGWTGPNGWGAQRELQAITDAPDAQSTTLAAAGGGEVTLVWSAELGRSAIQATGLPDVGADSTYELWYIDDAGAHPAGTFDPASGEAWRVLEGALGEGATVGITVEPAGGSPQPTTEPIVAIPT